MIKSEVILRSESKKGFVVTTFVVEFPRIILPEVLTHRAFSRNTSSSRARPFKNVLEQVVKNPFIPMYWQKSHRGMQGFEYHTGEYEDRLRSKWLKARDAAVKSAVELNGLNVSKQVVNRLLEPFVLCRMIVTTEEEGLENFFHLRRPKYANKKDEKEGDIRRSVAMAEPHIQVLAESMYISVRHSNILRSDIHIPFYDDITQSVEACARVSYNTIKSSKNNLFEQLLKDKHMSPFEHVLFSSNDKERYYNMQGWKSLRYRIEQEGLKDFYLLN